MHTEKNESDPSRAEWCRLYAAAQALHELAPWNWMGDENVIAVKNPVDHEIGYGIVMGCAGELFGLAVYLGDAGLKAYLHLKNTPAGEELILEAMHNNHALVLEFKKRSELDEQEKSLFKELGLNSRELRQFPSFRSYRPGYFPWPLTSEECSFLSICLEQITQVAADMKVNPLNFIPPGRGQFLLREQSQTADRAWQITWLTPRPLQRVIRVKFDIHPDLLNEIKALPSPPNVIFEVDWFFMPATIQENKKQRPFFPTVLMFSDEKSLMILNSHITSPEKYLGELHQKLIETIQGAQVRPSLIKVRKEDIYLCLEPLASKLNIPIKLVANLPAIAEARAGMPEFFRGGR